MDVCFPFKHCFTISSKEIAASVSKGTGTVQEIQADERTLFKIVISSHLFA
jgi:hypothetical protein